MCVWLELPWPVAEIIGAVWWQNLGWGLKRARGVGGLAIMRLWVGVGVCAPVLDS